MNHRILGHPIGRQPQLMQNVGEQVDLPEKIVMMCPIHAIWGYTGIYLIAPKMAARMSNGVLHLTYSVGTTTFLTWFIWCGCGGWLRNSASRSHLVMSWWFGQAQDPPTSK